MNIKGNEHKTNFLHFNYTLWYD